MLAQYPHDTSRVHGLRHEAANLRLIHLPNLSEFLFIRLLEMLKLLLGTVRFLQIWQVGRLPAHTIAGALHAQSK